MPLTFSLHAWRFRFTALQTIAFPAGKATNVFRGALGMQLRQLFCDAECPAAEACPRQQPCPYRSLFAPTNTSGPSGLHNAPRPFVLRAAHLDGAIIPSGGPFFFDLCLFVLKDPPIETFVRAFSALALEGLGSSRSGVRFEGLTPLGSDGEPEPGNVNDCLSSETPVSTITIRLDPAPERVEQIELEFLSPTELKSDLMPNGPPEFKVLFARVRDRIATLSCLYGAGALTADYQALSFAAAKVRLIDSNLVWTYTKRRSSRTGQVHPIGGFTGKVIYNGDLGVFLPWLEAACWTGVGRQTVWGKGMIRVIR